MIANGTLILMIDTTLYSADANDSIQCMQKFINEEDTTLRKSYGEDSLGETLVKPYEPESISALESIPVSEPDVGKKKKKEKVDSQEVLSLREKQESWIMDTINTALASGKPIKNVVIIGHHPLLYLKNKKGEDKLTTDISLFYPVLERIHGKLSDKQIKYYYLCADYHSYQHGFIKFPFNDREFTIEQYICGTGGTYLDDPLLDGKKRKEVYNDERGYPNIKYHFIRNTRKWGFLVCYTNESGLICLFKQNGSILGGKTKKRSRKQKYRKNKTVIRVNRKYL
jgi:hypothetical protein